MPVLLSSVANKIFKSSKVRICCKIFRCLSDLHPVRKYFTVDPFCCVNIELPCNVNIHPLNVHDYGNSDKVIVESIGRNVELCIEQKDLTQIGISAKQIGGIGSDPEICCNIEAPFKARLKLDAGGSIIAGHFQGDELNLRSTTGDVDVEKFQGTKFSACSDCGDVRLKGVIQASEIRANTITGSICADKLQGLEARLTTCEGNIQVKSSYCSRSHYETKDGNLDLQNIHESCTICIARQGNLRLSGMDGSFNAKVTQGNADVQISRITEHSSLVVSNGNILLRVSEENDASFKIKSKNLFIDEDVNLDNVGSGMHCISVQCPNGSVHIKSASWADIIRARMLKFQPRNTE